MKRTARRISHAWRVLTRRDRVTSEMDEEMRFHVGMEAERLMKAHGLPAGEARRRAFVSFGGVEQYKEAGHDVHGWRWLDALLLDSRFGLRMLVKHRGLSLVAAFAMAVAIAVGATAFETISRMLDSTLPFPGGDRLVQLQFLGATGGGEEEQLIHEFAALRGALTTVEHLSAYRNAQHNLVAAETAPEPVEVAEITASAFAITNTPALIGRYLLPSDEADAAAPAALISYQAWQLHFAGDPDVVGRTVRLGGVARTVVGVMPEGFGFPSRNEFWIPLRVNPLDYPPGGGPSLEIFGRLAPGATIEQARAEFAAVAQPLAAARAQNDLPLRPVVIPYTQFTDPDMTWMLRVAQLLSSALTVLVATNLAILVYARTVTRLGELAVRSALGASRRRILMQLFLEALALALAGAAAGLGIAAHALEAIQTMNETGELLPYWISFGLSARAVTAALGLAVMAALIIGVLPGLKATGGAFTAHLHDVHGRRWHSARSHLDGTDRGAGRGGGRGAAGGGVHFRPRHPRGTGRRRLPGRVHRRRSREAGSGCTDGRSGPSGGATAAASRQPRGGARRDWRGVFRRCSWLGADQIDPLPGRCSGAGTGRTRPGRGHH